jgi:UPF0755 protein
MTDKASVKFKKTLIITLCVVCVGVFIAGAYLYVKLYTSADSSGKPALFLVERGSSFNAIARKLVKDGFLKETKGISIAASLKGAHKKIKAGEYELSPAMSPVALLNVLVKGRIKSYSITFPEGFNIKDIAALLEEKGFGKKGDFIERAMDKEFATSFGLKGKTLEGYLFPDTYSFTKGATAEDIIRKMVATFKAVYEREFRAEAEKKGMTTTKLVTLASIIEKETGRLVEMPIISAVFRNRLRKRIRLGSDPTVIYGVKNFNGNLTKKHLLTRTPYNTYRNYGLPPGPIASPGRAALKAALNPADVSYLYFVSRNDGTHKFSNTLREHNNAVRKYQNRRYGRKK